MRIKELIKEKGLTQKEFASTLGMSPVGLNQLINGKPSYPTLEKFAHALNVPLWQLFASPDEVQGKQGDEVCAFVRFRASNNDVVHLHADTWAEFWAIVDEIASSHPRPRKQP